MRAEVRGVELAYEVAGGGRPFVWGHGLTSSRADEDAPPRLIEWDRVAAQVQLLRYDARGHGQSGFTPDARDYGWDALARDQRELVDHVGFDRFVVGGASMGAATALHTAVASPDRVEALVLVIPPTAWQTRAGQSELYLQMARIVESRGVEPLIQVARDMPPPDPFLGDAAYRDRFAARLRSADPVRLAGVFRGAATADLPPKAAVAELDVPALILAWTGDTGHPVSSAEELAELLPQADAHLAETHDDLEGWTNRVLDFLAT